MLQSQPGITTRIVLVGLSCFFDCEHMLSGRVCVHNGSVQLGSMKHECSYQNEKHSSFITTVIECSLPVIGVSLTQCSCPSRYGSVQDLGFQSRLSAMDHHVEISGVRSLTGRLQYLRVISSY